jgi:hypothetical protein
MSAGRREALARNLLRKAAPLVLLAECILLVSLHNSEEAQPVITVMITMLPIVVLTGFAAVVPFRTTEPGISASDGAAI